MTQKTTGFGRESIKIDGHQYKMIGTGTKRAFPYGMGANGPVYGPTIKLMVTRLRRDLGISVRVLPVTSVKGRTGPRFGIFVLRTNFARARSYLLENRIHEA